MKSASTIALVMVTVIFAVAFLVLGGDEWFSITWQTSILPSLMKGLASLFLFLVFYKALIHLDKDWDWDELMSGRNNVYAYWYIVKVVVIGLISIFAVW